MEVIFELVFLLLDEDNSGGLEKKEFEKFACYMQQHHGQSTPTEEEMQDMFKSFDANNDGKVTLNEILEKTREEMR